MNKTQVDKAQENKSQAVANSLPKLQSGNELVSQFVDNRPEAIAQKKLQESISNSSQVQQFKAFQEMANNSPRVKQLQAYQTMTGPFSVQPAQQLQGKAAPVQKKENNTGLPNSLKLGVENLSGYSMDDVKVHYNSDKPAQLNAYAFAQGTDIHVASGQEKHLPHEAWHVVQQKQGRVQATSQLKGYVAINDDKGLEQEADVMGWTASQFSGNSLSGGTSQLKKTDGGKVTQRRPIHSSFHGDFNSDELERDEVIGIYKQLLRINGDQTAIRQLAAAIRNNEFIGAPINIDDIDEWSIEEHIITYDEVNYSLCDMNRFSQEIFYDTDADGLNYIWDQLNELDQDTIGPKDKRQFNEIKLKVHNSWELNQHKDNAFAGWEERYGTAPGEGDTLHDLVYNVIVDAIGDRSVIQGMSYDKIFQYNAETQIAYCLEECRDDDEDVLALCLYTSYFYEPLNRYFRGQLVPDGGTNFGQLILRTAEILEGSYEEEADTEIADKRYRLELKSGWIGDDEESINFAALTSTHPNLDGIRGMWGDVAAGTFGEYDNLALLTFEGTAKIKRPEKKYFDTESEDLMAPGSEYHVVERYTVQGNIPRIGQKTIRVIRLSNAEPPYPDAAQLNFGNIVP